MNATDLKIYKVQQILGVVHVNVNFFNYGLRLRMETKLPPRWI
jgi:hypothetical protein